MTPNLSSPAAILVLFCALLASCERPASLATASGEIAATPVIEESMDLPAEVSFNEHIQPILSEYCYQCHGPDSGTREPSSDPLRLDLADAVYTEREGGPPPIVKGDPAASSIVMRMLSRDPDEKMPPPEAHKTMEPREIALIERWIEQGGEYQAHWAFNPVVKYAPPAVGGDWVKNPIDGFVFERLEAAGLAPNPPEAWPRFFRRLSFDLTGLPPEPAELAAFVTAAAADPDGAVAAAADRLMTTPAHAEHMARHWLDAARYADTHGIHIDNYRAIWPYRDWVINAFQENLPWDQFTTEQIAGDLLPERTLDQHVASGFNRCLATTGEGGAIPEEYDAIYARDRVDATSAIWLGLTASCASCHDHKFDPISTQDFYALTAFFRNNTMSAMDGNNAEHAPIIHVPLREDRPRWESISGEITAAEAALAARTAAAEPDFKQWLADPAQQVSADVTEGLSLHLPLNEAEGPVRGSLDGAPLEIPVEIARVESQPGHAALASHQPVDLGDFAAFSRGDQVSYGGFIRVEGTPNGAVIARLNPASAYRGWDLFLVAGKPSAHVIDTWQEKGSKIVAPNALEPGRWYHVMVTFNGQNPSPTTLEIFVDGVRQNAKLDANGVGPEIVSDVPLRLGARFGGESTLTAPVHFKDFRFYRRLLAPEEIARLSQAGTIEPLLALPEEQRSDEQRAALFQHFLAQVDEPSQQLRRQLEALKAEQNSLRERGSKTLVMEEIPNREPHAHILIRGEYSDKGERVTANTPAALPPMPEGAPKNRLGLAMWLNDPSNPLPARVTMNRTWYYFFGTGIVESTDDFGIMGARPSHPQMLDWLAAEFVESKWNYRHMLKQIVTSATYRQSGVVTPAKLEKDPHNRLLSRGPRYRLDAEQIRDLALASSGLLVPKIGGPSVRPYQPEGIWEAVAMKESNTRNYKPDSGESLYRRSIYTFWKRTAHNPTMEILNAPSREIFCVRRELTNTPLQALVTLNDPQFVEASRRLAENTLVAAPDFDARLDHAALRLISRDLDDSERVIARRTFDAALASFQADPEAATSFINTGESKPSDTAEPVELAAWTLLCSQLLNLDETLNK
jgi:hypothetical protein